MDSLRFMDFRVQTFIKRKLDCDIQCRPLTCHVMVVQVFLHWLVKPWSNKTKEPARRKVARLQKTRGWWQWPSVAEIVESSRFKHRTSTTLRIWEITTSIEIRRDDTMTLYQTSLQAITSHFRDPALPLWWGVKKSKQQGSEGKELIMWSILALTSPNSAHIAFVICPTRW